MRNINSLNRTPPTLTGVMQTGHTPSNVAATNAATAIKEIKSAVGEELNNLESFPLKNGDQDYAAKKQFLNSFKLAIKIAQDFANGKRTDINLTPEDLKNYGKNSCDEELLKKMGGNENFRQLLQAICPGQEKKKTFFGGTLYSEPAQQLRTWLDNEMHKLENGEKNLNNINKKLDKAAADVKKHRAIGAGLDVAENKLNDARGKERTASRNYESALGEVSKCLRQIERCADDNQRVGLGKKLQQAQKNANEAKHKHEKAHAFVVDCQKAVARCTTSIKIVGDNMRLIKKLKLARVKLAQG